MVVKIKAKFTDAQIRKYLVEQMQRIQEAIFRRLQRVGETFVTNARQNGAYMDQTGNLRSSIGYVILKDGVQVAGKFEGDKQEGRQRGKEVAAEVGAQYPRGLILICVAGMDYASAVEAKGRDVITGSSLIAVEQLKAAMQSIQRKAA